MTVCRRVSIEHNSLLAQYLQTSQLIERCWMLETTRSRTRSSLSCITVIDCNTWYRLRHSYV